MRDASRIGDPTEIELLAAGLVPPALHEAGPPGAVAALVAVIGEAKGGREWLLPRPSGRGR